MSRVESSRVSPNEGRGAAPRVPVAGTPCRARLRSWMMSSVVLKVRQRGVGKGVMVRSVDSLVYAGQ
jgi:hypothetical protein